MCPSSAPTPVYITYIKEKISDVSAHIHRDIHTQSSSSSCRFVSIFFPCLVCFLLVFTVLFFLFFPPYEFMLPVFIFWCSRPVCCVGGFRVHPVDRKDESSQFFFSVFGLQRGEICCSKTSLPVLRRKRRGKHWLYFFP